VTFQFHPLFPDDKKAVPFFFLKKLAEGATGRSVLLGKVGEQITVDDSDSQDGIPFLKNGSGVSRAKTACLEKLGSGPVIIHQFIEKSIEVPSFGLSLQFANRAPWLG